MEVNDRCLLVRIALVIASLILVILGVSDIVSYVSGSLVVPFEAGSEGWLYSGKATFLVATSASVVLGLYFLIFWGIIGGSLVKSKRKINCQICSFVALVEILLIWIMGL